MKNLTEITPIVGNSKGSDCRIKVEIMRVIGGINVNKIRVVFNAHILTVPPTILRMQPFRTLGLFSLLLHEQTPGHRIPMVQKEEKSNLVLIVRNFRFRTMFVV